MNQISVETTVEALISWLGLWSPCSRGCVHCPIQGIHGTNTRASRQKTILLCARRRPRAAEQGEELDMVRSSARYYRKHRPCSAPLQSRRPLHAKADLTIDRPCSQRQCAEPGGALGQLPLRLRSCGGERCQGPIPWHEGWV